MGEIADSIINGEFDMFTGEYIGSPCGFPRTKQRGNKKPKYWCKKTAYINLTPSERKIASIRKEIALDVKYNGLTIGEARRKANQKYGKGWRERGLVVNSSDQWSEDDLREFL